MSVMMDSGRIRHRRVHELPIETQTLSWTFTEDEFEAFQAFFENDLENGSLPFSLEIYGESKEVSFLDGSYQFSRGDNVYSVTATVLHVSLPPVTLTVTMEEVV